MRGPPPARPAVVGVPPSPPLAASVAACGAARRAPSGAPASPRPGRLGVDPVAGHDALLRISASSVSWAALTYRSCGGPRRRPRPRRRVGGQPTAWAAAWLPSTSTGEVQPSSSSQRAGGWLGRRGRRRSTPVQVDPSGSPPLSTQSDHRPSACSGGTSGPEDDDGGPASAGRVRAGRRGRAGERRHGPDRGVGAAVGQLRQRRALDYGRGVVGDGRVGEPGPGVVGGVRVAGGRGVARPRRGVDAAVVVVRTGDQGRHQGDHDDGDDDRGHDRDGAVGAPGGGPLSGGRARGSVGGCAHVVSWGRASSRATMANPDSAMVGIVM